VKIDFIAPDAADLDSFIKLMRELYAHDTISFDEAHARAALAGLLNNPAHGSAWFINADGSVAGYIVVTFGYSLEFQGVDAFLDELFISKPYRRQGIGRRAIAFAELVCKERGVRAMHLEVDRANTNAQSLYRELGFMDHDRYLLTKWFIE